MASRSRSRNSKLAAELATPAATDPIFRPAAPVAPSTIEPAPCVATIRCDAWLANWDADAEFDGFLVDIAALDSRGRTLDVQGTVQAELIGVDYQPGYLNSSSPGGRVPIELSRWSQPWEKQRRYVQLEYQTRDPQRDGNLSRYAMLKVRLTIPGHGVFEQQLDGLRTRPFSPVGNLLR